MLQRPAAHLETTVTDSMLMWHDEALSLPRGEGTDENLWRQTAQEIQDSSDEVHASLAAAAVCAR
jgi:hypothetical protein